MIHENRKQGYQPRVSYLTFALLACIAQVAQAQDGATAEVQEPTAKESTDGEKTTQLDTVIVTGTNIEGIKPIGSSSMALEREEVLATGAVNLSDVVRRIPQVQSNDAFREGGTVGGANNTQGNALNLRGIGASATLLLIDGRRVAPTGTTLGFTEANQIPLAALERVEVIADGASAVYGSDAVAGIINYVLRKDYEGAELSYRFSDEGGFHQRVGSLAAGTAWDGFGALGRGNVLFTYERTNRDALRAGDNPLLRQDLTRYGGLDGRLNGASATPGFTPNIVVQRADGSTNPSLPNAGANDYYGLPVGTNGVGLSASDLRLNQPNLLDAADYSDYLGKMERDQISLFFNQQLTERLSFYAQGLYRKRETVSYTMGVGSSSQYSSTVSLPSSSPYYISGVPGVAPGAPLTVQYNAYKDVGPVNFTNDEKQITWTAGFKAELPGDWKGEFYYTDSENDSCGYCNFGTFINWDAFNAQVASGNINPLSSEPLSAAQVSTFIGNNLQFSNSSMKNAMLKFNGPLFELPAGKVRGAIGAEYLENSNILTNEANRGALNAYVHDTTSGLERDVTSLFAEIYVPIIGEDSGVAGVKSLSLSGAIRRDDYSDVGATTNPKIGLTWEVTDNLSLRGSWGESFRAPNLPEMNPYVFSVAVATPTQNNSGDPGIVNGAFPGFTNQLFLLGSNAALTPETAETWSAGLDYDFSAIEGLRLSATYYSIKYDDRIAAPPSGEFLASPEGRALWDAYITPIHQPASCVEGDYSTYDPALLPFVNLPSLFGVRIVPDCAINVVLDGRNTNMASTKQTGLDLALNYSIPSDFGFWNIGASATRVLKHDQQVSLDSPMEDRRNRYNEPSSTRARANVGWFYNEWSVNLFANYVGGYTNDLPITVAGTRLPEHEVGSWTTFDLGVSWAPTIEANWVHGVRVGVNINNLFDRDPPLVLSGNTPFNAMKSDPFGRTWSVSVTLNY